MNKEQILQMVRDYLYLTPYNITKRGYRHCVNLAMCVLTDLAGESGEDSSDGEFKLTHDMRLLYDEYRWLVTLKLVNYLDEAIEPYTCAGSGDTYRHYHIKHEQEPLVIICADEILTEDELNVHLEDCLCYPIKIKIERKEAFGGPTWLPYHD